MAQIRHRKHSASHLLALVAASLPVAHAHSATAETTLPTIEVSAAADGYKVEQLSSAKSTEPLINTTKTVSVINKELIEEQGATTLVEALRNTPGITLQLGENGNTSSGDAFQMRGFSTQNSTLVDGIRDLGAVTRDVFNLEQIEVVKGPAGSEIGRGASSGYVNLVSKLPQQNNDKSVGLTWNTADQKRLTADLNQDLGDGMAARLNAMWQDGGVEGRDVIARKNYAIAPAFAFGLDTATRFYLYSQHAHQENIPDGGIPTIGLEGFVATAPSNPTAEQSALANALNRAPAVNRNNYYGASDDLEEVDAHMATLKIEHDFTESLSIQNLSRIGQTEMQRSLTGLMTSTLTTPDLDNRNTWTVRRTRQGVDQTNKIIANQTNLNVAFETGNLKHRLVAGLELSKEEQDSNTRSVTRAGTATVAIPDASLYNPNPNSPLPPLFATGAYSNGATTTTALYVFDTVELSEQLQLNAGIRADRYKTTTDALSLSTNATTLVVTPTKTDLEKSDTLISWNLGALFKPTANSSVYASYAKSLTPPGSSNFSLSADATRQDNPNIDPQETHNYEVGTKWDVMDGKLALTAALYRTDNENQLTQNPADGLYSQEGKIQIQGVELSAVGKLSPVWDISAGLTTMDAKQKNQHSKNATTGVVTVTDGVRWTPDFAATVWSTYALGDVKIGGGVRHTAEQKRQVSQVAGQAVVAGSMDNIPAYTVLDAMASYQVNPQASVVLNVYNLADEDYFSTLNNGGNRLVLGEPRSAKLALNYKF